MAQKDLKELVVETKKQLEHLRALGVEGIRVADSTLTKIPPVQPKAAAVIGETITPKPSISLFGDIAPAPAKLIPSGETFRSICSETHYPPVQYFLDGHSFIG